MSERGFSIVEAMVAVAVISMFMAATVGITGRLNRSGATARAYVDDVSRCQRALRQIDADLRCARSVAQSKDGVQVELDEETVVYRLADGVLTRTSPTVSAVVARRIAGFDLTTRGRLVTMRLELLPRSANAARVAVVESTLCLAGGPR